MLTDPDCKNATCPPDKKRSRLTDSAGLYLEVSPGGSKRWFLKLYQDGKETRIALGSYPAVTLKAARMARDAAKLQKSEGRDPIEARKVKKLKASSPAENTFKAAAVEWLAQSAPGWSDTHHVRERRNLEKDLFPYIGARVIREIEPVELLAVVRRVEERGALSVADRVLLTAHSVWLYAVATGRADRDITGDIRKALKPRIAKNYPAITDPAELAQLLRACNAYKGGPWCGRRSSWRLSCFSVRATCARCGG